MQILVALQQRGCLESERIGLDSDIFINFMMYLFPGIEHRDE